MRAFVVDLLARNRLQAGGDFLRRLAAVGLDHADDHVFAAALAANGLAQHGIGFADTRRIAEKQLEDAALLFGRGLLQPLLGRLLHEPLFCGRGREKSIRYNHAVDAQPQAGGAGQSRLADSPSRAAPADRCSFAMPSRWARSRIVVLAYRRLPVNPTTVALTFLLVVLGLASRWGLTIATTTAVVATLAFNYFFLPPVHTFTIYRSAELDRAAGISDQRDCGQPAFGARPPRSRECHPPPQGSRAAVLPQPATAGHGQCDGAAQLHSRISCATPLD